MTVKLKRKTLHLDCALNVVGECLVVNYGSIKKHSINFSKYSNTVIQINKSEQRYLATNFLSINKNTIITNSQCKKTNQIIAEAGIKVIEIKFSEMIKLGGSFRCCTLEINKQ